MTVTSLAPERSLLLFRIPDWKRISNLRHDSYFHHQAPYIGRSREPNFFVSVSGEQVSRFVEGKRLVSRALRLRSRRMHPHWSPMEKRTRPSPHPLARRHGSRFACANAATAMSLLKRSTAVPSALSRKADTRPGGDALPVCASLVLREDGQCCTTANGHLQFAPGAPIQKTIRIHRSEIRTITRFGNSGCTHTVNTNLHSTSPYISCWQIACLTA